MSIHNLLWKVFNREENGYFLVYTFLLRLLWQALVNHNCLGFKRFALSVHFCNITWNFSWNVSAHIIGVFIARGKEDALVTLNMVPGETVYGEKKIVVEVSIKNPKIFPLVIQKFGINEMNGLRKMKPVNFYINQLQLCYSWLLTCVQFYTKVQQW